jgi:hypothetical protein
VWPIALGIGFLLLGLFVTVIVCSRMNDPLPERGAHDTPPLARRGADAEDSTEGFEA